MDREFKVIESSSEPCCKNVLWLTNEGLKQYKSGSWQLISSAGSSKSNSSSSSEEELFPINLSFDKRSNESSVTLLVTKGENLVNAGNLKLRFLRLKHRGVKYKTRWSRVMNENSSLYNPITYEIVETKSTNGDMVVSVPNYRLVIAKSAITQHVDTIVNAREHLVLDSEFEKRKHFILCSANGRLYKAYNTIGIALYDNNTRVSNIVQLKVGQFHRTQYQSNNREEQFWNNCRISIIENPDSSLSASAYLEVRQ